MESYVVELLEQQVSHLAKITRVGEEEIDHVLDALAEGSEKRQNWSGALNQFAILFEGRVPMSGFSSSSLTQNFA